MKAVKFTGRRCKVKLIGRGGWVKHVHVERSIPMTTHIIVPGIGQPDRFFFRHGHTMTYIERIA